MRRGRQEWADGGVVGAGGPQEVSEHQLSMVLVTGDVERKDPNSFLLFFTMCSMYAIRLLTVMDFSTLCANLTHVR